MYSDLWQVFRSVASIQIYGKYSDMSVASSQICDYCLSTIFQKLHFSKSHFSENPQEKYDHVTILHSISPKKCHKNFENWLTNKKFMPESNFGSRAFSIVKMSAWEVTIFREKI